MVCVCVDVKIEPVKVACVVECVFIIKSVSLEIFWRTLSRVGKNLISSLVISKKESREDTRKMVLTKSLLLYNKFLTSTKKIQTLLSCLMTEN
jgi:hypothetical protein